MIAHRGPTGGGRCDLDVHFRAYVTRFRRIRGGQARIQGSLSDSEDIIVIDGEGNVVVEGKAARLRLRTRDGRYRLVADAAGLIILRRELPGEHELGLEDEIDALFELADVDSTETEPGGRVLMAGEILNAMTLFQIIEVIGERNWKGDLHVFADDGTSFELSFDQGALTHARSNHEADRLGELLLRENVITRAQLTDLLWEVSKDRRLGQVCLDKGVLDRTRLFEYLRQQTEGIFNRTLLVDEGAYMFATPDPTQQRSDLEVHLPVRGLLMTGVQRLDEMQLYRDRIPSLDLCLESVIAADERDLDDDQKLVLAESDGETTLEKIVATTGLEEFAVVKAAYHLVKRGIARVQSRSTIDEAVVRRLTESFSEALEEIFVTIAQNGDLPAAQSMLAAWVTGSGYDEYFGEDVAHGGRIDFEQVLGVLHAGREDDPMSVFHHIGHELVSFALFCAGSVLPRELERKLSVQVNRKLQELRR